LRISAIIFSRVVLLAHDARRDFTRVDGHRLVDDALLLRVVAHLDMAGEREVLAERMADEAVVGEDAAQVRVAVEDDAEQVERLALEPVRHRPHVDQRSDHRKPVVGCENPDAKPDIVFVESRWRTTAKRLPSRGRSPYAA
jgi:hypothetical protein